MPDWKSLKEAMNSQFGTTKYEDFYGELTRSNHESTVKDYTIKFNRLATRAYMTEKQKISNYTRGLKHTLRMKVKSQKPVSFVGCSRGS